MTTVEREIHPGDLGLILLQCPVALGMEGHDCNGPDCNCGGTILTPDAWLYVNRRSTSAAERGMREALKNAARLIDADCPGSARDVIRSALSGIEGEDEQARGQGRSAPISTDTKGTSNDR